MAGLELTEICGPCLTCVGITGVCNHTCCVFKYIFRRTLGEVSTGEKTKYNLESF